MKLKGFTLIELLAVIVILAIISLIAVPIALKVVQNIKMASMRLSLDNYAKAVENATLSYMRKNNGLAPANFNDVKTYIEYSGEEPNCEFVSISQDGEVILSNCKINNVLVKSKTGSNYSSQTSDFEYANYSVEQIENNDHIFGIGANDQNSVVAIFSDDFTSVKIMNNTKDSDGIIMSWIRNSSVNYTDGSTDINLSGEAYTSLNPFYAYRALLQNVEIEEGITEIGDYSFNYCKNISNELNLPDSLIKINQSAFSNTQIRGDLILPSNLRNIGAFAFSNTTNLIGKLYISNSLSTIGYAAFFESSISSIEFEDNSKLVLISDLAFGMCEKISGEVNIPGSVKYIGTYAFEVCSSIDKIVLNEGLLWIGDFAFEHIPNLSNTSINIPSTVKQIGGKNYTGEVTSHGVNPFYDTGKSLTNFIVADVNTNYKVIDGVLYSKDGTVLVSYPNKKVSSSYEMLDTCTTTFATAFSRNQNLKNLTLSDSFVVEDSTSWYTHDSSYINDTNNLSASLYKYSALENISVKSTNTKYKSENGLLLSNDGKILYYVPRYNSNGQILLLPNVETIFKGAIVKQNSEATGISIPATVKDIQGTGITDINSIFSGNIIINESNSVYTIDSSGKLIIK